MFSSKNAIRLLKEALQVRALGISNRNIQRGDSSLIINVSLHRYSKDSGDVLSMVPSTFSLLDIIQRIENRYVNTEICGYCKFS